MTALFQQELCRRPFWMLVACVLANRTRWSRAEPTFRAIRRRWPNPLALAHASERLEDELRPLGLWRARSACLRGLGFAWTHDSRRRWRTATSADVIKLPGCGRYAADSWAIFVEGRRDVRPTDKELRKFLEEERCARA